jgi:ABC-type transport system involved in multi-copper enzyme maturation permease subunit
MYCDYSLALENYEHLLPESGEDYVVIPPTPLSIFARGLEENLCRSYEDDGGVSGKQQSVNNLFKLFTAPDLMYIIKVILSLCAMLFAFDMVSGEKENGTLRQTISNTMKRPILIIGKWIGGFASFILPFFITVLFGTILVTLSPIVDIKGGDWIKLGLFLLCSVIYLSVFFSLGLLISCLTHRSSTSLVISLFVWTILVFLIPNLGNILARQLVKIPTVQQLEFKLGQNWIKANFEFDRADGKKRRETFNHFLAEKDKYIEDYRNHFNRLLTVSQNITRLSPSAVFTFLGTDIMTTGISEERKLKRVASQYWDNKRGSDQVFVYQRSPIIEVFGPKSLINCFILVLFNILFSTGAYVAFLKYDVR